MHRKTEPDVGWKLLWICVEKAMLMQKRPYLGKRQTMLTKYPHIQCFTCPTHDIDGFTKIICVSKEEIQMQRNEMGRVGVQHVVWDADLFEATFAQA